MASQQPFATQMPSASGVSSSSSGSTSAAERQSIKDIVFREVMSGNWDVVLNNYYKDDEQNIQTASITSSKETVLHIAISDNRSDVALQLLHILKEYPEKIGKMKNERENNPLHLAAYLGQADMCAAMVELDPTLILSRNVDGETPLFLAALHGKKEAFYTLHRKWADIRGKDKDIKEDDISHCKRNDGNSILHVTILGEYFELAFQTVKLYPELSKYKNERGQSALHILATNPSAFRSGCHLGPLDDFIYRCLLVEKLELEEEAIPKGSLRAEQNQNSEETKIEIPGNYETCFNIMEIFWKGLCAVFSPATWKAYWSKTDTRTPHEPKKNAPENKLPFPPNYYTFFSFLEFMMELLLVICGLGFYKVIKMKDKKRKHTQSLQLMKELVSSANLWENEDTGSKPSEESLQSFHDDSIVMMTRPPDTSSELNIADTLRTEEDATTDVDDKDKGITAMASDEMSKTRISNNHGKSSKHADEEKKQSSEKKSADEEGTKEKSPFLVAAKMGVIEMVDEILNRFPVAIDDMNQEKKNAVLLAVENRQPGVYLYLKKRYPKKESIFQKVDSQGNSALHLAAWFAENRPWLIPGAALQMQWELKWYKFIKDSMPRHFFAHLNGKRQTPKEVLTVTHKDLAKVAGKWLTSTAESCSVVAALIATVAFASATTLPGGLKQDEGTPIFEGEPAFNIFAISSLVALCFSVTSLTMFLSILTSRYQVWDFHQSLPSKLILGLTSLFVSIASILVSFCSGHFLAIRDKLRYAVFPIYAATCLPLTLFAVAQSPLYLDLIRSIMAPIPRRSFEEACELCDSLNGIE